MNGSDDTFAASRLPVRDLPVGVSNPGAFGPDSRRPPQPLFPPHLQKDPVSWKSGLFFTYTFLICARPQEFFLPIPKLIFIFGILAFVAIAIHGSLRVVLTSHFGRMFLGLAGLMLLSAPFGHWPGGSLTLILAWVPNVMLFLMGAQVLTRTETLRRGLYVLAASSAFIATMTIIFGGESLGRLRLSTGDLGNPNDLATIMLFCLPGWMLLWHRKESVVFSRILAAAGMSACVLSALRTGSRSGLIALSAMSLAIFYRLSVPKKVLVAVLGSALVIVGIQLLPGAVRARYQVMLGIDQIDPEYQKEQEAAIGSSDERRLLLQESIRLAFQHPLLGVGPGQFPDVAGQDLRTQGRSGAWMNTHNAYTQIASEIGIPAFVIYLSILVGCWRATRFRGSSNTPQSEEIELRDVAFCIRLALLSFCINSFFTSIAYSFYVPILACLAVGFKNSTALGVSAPSPRLTHRFQQAPLERY